MIREVVRAQSDRLMVNIPKEYINKDLEILIFSIDEAKRVEKKYETDKLLEEFKKITKNPAKVDKNIDIVKLDEDMYDDIF